MGKSKSSRPRNRVVHSHNGGGRFGTGLGSSGILGNRALARKREEAVSQRARAAQGLSTELQNALDDISGTAEGDPAANDMVVDGVDFSHHFEDQHSDSEQTADFQNIIVDIRDVVRFKKWHGRRRYRGQTWKERINRFNDAWASIIDELVDDYIQWRYSSPLPTSPLPSTSETSGWDFTIEVIDLYTVQYEATILRNEDTKSTSALAQAGYLAASPVSPSLAVSLRTLELLRTIRLFKPNFSIEAFAKTVCHLYAKPYRRGYRTALSDTFDIYLAILRKVDARVSTELGHDAPDYRVLHSCPPCNYELEDEPSLTFTRMFVADGNNSLKRMDGVGKREVADRRVFGESDYYLSEEYVDTFADEVKARPRSKNAIDDGEEEEGDWADEIHGDPTDGAPDGDPCTKNWKAAAADTLKKMWSAFRETGYFATACRHGFVLWVADMVRSGELAKYPLAMVAKALKTFGTHWLFGYDIGCSFGVTIANSSLGPEFKEKGCRTCVNAFHGYSHNAICQQLFHPLNILGIGLEDLETLERLFSSSNQLGSITRYMSPYRRRVFIDLFLQQWDRDKYQNLATMLHNNYVQALDIIENEVPTFKADLQALNITEDNLETYLANETSHLQALGSETEEDLHAAAYVELLRKYRETNAAFQNSDANFRLHIPDDYQFLTDDMAYTINLSETRKAETKRRFLSEQAPKLLFEVVQMETAMGITRRWETSDPEYKRAVEYVNTQRYRQALERLHKLVVQRLFELHKMNLSNTGYKMRTHISNALQRRSKAIRNAVRTYNAAALALNPPRDTLDWSKVSHYTFLDQFNILQDTRHSVFTQAWAKPVNRALMKQHRRIVRAREEVTRCNIELRRLHTHIVDEGKSFDALLQKLAESPMLGPVSDYIQRRRAVNNLLLARIHQTYDLEGFTGNCIPGTRQGISSNVASQAPCNSHAPDVGSDDGEDEDDDEFTEELGSAFVSLRNQSNPPFQQHGISVDISVEADSASQAKGLQTRLMKLPPVQNQLHRMPLYSLHPQRNPDHLCFDLGRDNARAYTACHADYGDEEKEVMESALLKMRAKAKDEYAQKFNPLFKYYHDKMRQRALHLIAPLQTLTTEQEQWIHIQARDRAAAKLDAEAKKERETKKRSEDWVEVNSDNELVD